MTNRNYKRYMKQEVKKDYNLIKLFIISFCGMLLFFIFIIKSFSPPVDVSIGDNTETNTTTENANIDGRLSALQEEDSEKSFSDIVTHASDVEPDKTVNKEVTKQQEPTTSSSEQEPAAAAQPVYKVYIGSYTSAEQAKVARDIIQDAGNGLTPIVKCIGSNNYTLQVGLFKSKSSAEALLYSVQQNHLPGRIVQEY